MFKRRKASSLVNTVKMGRTSLVLFCTCALEMIKPDVWEDCRFLHDNSLDVSFRPSQSSDSGISQINNTFTHLCSRINKLSQKTTEISRITIVCVQQTHPSWVDAMWKKKVNSKIKGTKMCSRSQKNVAFLSKY